MKKATLKWQIEFLEQIKNMTNEHLLWETVQAAAGDDYDGCFTSKGQWEYEVLQVALVERLGDWLD